MNLEQLNPLVHKNHLDCKDYPPDDFGPRWFEVTREEIAEVETALGKRLPGPYSEFLRHYGAFGLMDDDFGDLRVRVVFADGRHVNDHISEISQPKPSLETYTLQLDGPQSDDPILPPELFPIAVGPGDGSFYLDISDENFGKVRFLSVKTKPFGSPGYGWEQVGAVADSFEDFIAGIGTAKQVNKTFGPPKK